MHPTFCPNLPQSLRGTSLESWKSKQKIVFSIEVWMIYNIALVSGVQQSDSVLYIYMYIYKIIFSDYFPLYIIIRY